jgi:hypothetical protein
MEVLSERLLKNMKFHNMPLIVVHSVVNILLKDRLLVSGSAKLVLELLLVVPGHLLLIMLKPPNRLY